jgi:hypothetical protein
VIELKVCVTGADRVQGKLFAQQCLANFAGMATLQLPENYRSVPSIVEASVAVLRTTVGGALSVPRPMRRRDIAPLFTTSPSFLVRLSPSH